MDTLRETCDDVNNSPQGMLGGRRGGEYRRTPTQSSGGRTHLVGDEAPELICDCDVIPFPHFISQCTQLRVYEARDAIAHVSDTEETPVL